MKWTRKDGELVIKERRPLYLMMIVVIEKFSRDFYCDRRQFRVLSWTTPRIDILYIYTLYLEAATNLTYCSIVTPSTLR